MALFGWLSFVVFELEPCPLNHFERDDMCYDCLAPLDNCLSCTQEKICDACVDGYYLDFL